MDNEDLQIAARILKAANRVAVLTGAGVSAESGVPTFRGPAGLWEGRRVEDVASPNAFARNPAMVWRFYHERRKRLREIKPNPGHYALVALEQRFAGNFALITQNVDGLHRLAGSQQVLELHGSLARVKCTSCPAFQDMGLIDLPDLPLCSACQELVRPDVVWFGEMLNIDLFARAQRAAELCDCFLVVGTSAVVHPAAGLARVAADAGAQVIEINTERSAVTDWVSLSLRGPSGEILPALVAAG